MKRSSRSKDSTEPGGKLPDFLSDRRVSIFKSATSKTPSKVATLDEIFQQIESKRLPLQDKIRKLQEQWIQAKAAHGEKSDEAKTIYREKQKLKEKSWLPAFSLSALFNGKRANENVSQHSGALQIDIDHLESASEWNRVCKALQKSPHIWKIWRSISGDGIKAALLVPRSTEQHRDAFRAAASHVYELTGKQIDEACKDPARICFFSHSKVWTNPEAFPIEPIAGRNGSTPLVTGHPTSDRDPLKEKVREIAESVVGLLGEWQTDERGRVFAYCRCPDTSREHHNEATPNTRVYLNPGSVPRIECRHGECAPIVKKRNEVLRREWLSQNNVQVLPAIENANAFINTEIDLPPDVIEGLLHRDGKMVAGGGSKSFKTWLQQDLAVSVATGIPWLGFPTKAGRVLCLNLELSGAFYRWRIQQICRAKGVMSAELLDVWNLRGYAMDVESFIPKIIERIETTGHEYSLIDLDPIYKLLGRRDENKAGDIAAVMNAIERLTVQSKAAVLFGAHYSKGNQADKESIDRIGGSGVFARDPDTIMNFTRHKIDDAYTVESVLRNHPPIADFCVRWQFPLMVRDDSLDPSDLKRAKGGAPRKVSDQKLIALLEPQPLRPTVWQEKSGLASSTFYDRVEQLKAAGRIMKNENGEWYVPF